VSQAVQILLMTVLAASLGASGWLFARGGRGGPDGACPSPAGRPGPVTPLPPAQPWPRRPPVAQPPATGAGAARQPVPVRPVRQNTSTAGRIALRAKAGGYASRPGGHL
jgi:hypothetical protein